MEMLWFGHAGRPMIWFPTSVGRFYQNEDFGLVGAVADLVEGGAIQVAAWTASTPRASTRRASHPAERIRRHDQYDRYLHDEVVPFVRGKARTGRPKSRRSAPPSAPTTRSTSGSAIPDSCDKVVGFSGKYDIHSFLDGYWDELCYFHCPTAYVPNMDRRVGRQALAMDICIVTGETDNILAGSTDMIRDPRREGHPPPRRHLGRAYGHDWPWWKEQIRLRALTSGGQRQPEEPTQVLSLLKSTPIILPCERRASVVHGEGLVVSSRRT